MPGLLTAACISRVLTTWEESTKPQWDAVWQDVSTAASKLLWKTGSQLWQTCYITGITGRIQQIWKETKFGWTRKALVSKYINKWIDCALYVCFLISLENEDVHSRLMIYYYKLLSQINCNYWNGMTGNIFYFRNGSFNTRTNIKQ